MLYRVRTGIVEAIQFNGTNEHEVLKFTKDFFPRMGQFVVVDNQGHWSIMEPLHFHAKYERLV